MSDDHGPLYQPPVKLLSRGGGRGSVSIPTTREASC